MAEQRACWHEQLAVEPPARLVFVDESGANTRMTRWRGRSPLGQRLVAPLPHGHYQTSTLIAGVRLGGACAPWLFAGAMDGEMFSSVVRRAVGGERDAREFVARLRELWTILLERNPCHLVQVGFDSPPAGAWGSLEDTLPEGRRRVVASANLAMAADLPQGVSFVDANALSAEVGPGYWSAAEWHAAKQYPLSAALPRLADALCAHRAAALGLAPRSWWSIWTIPSGAASSAKTCSKGSASVRRPPKEKATVSCSSTSKSCSNAACSWPSAQKTIRPTRNCPSAATTTCC